MWRYELTDEQWESTENLPPLRTYAVVQYKHDAPASEQANPAG